MSKGTDRVLFVLVVADACARQRTHARVLTHCLSPGNTDMARGIFYRAIRSVPWAKALWLDSMRRLRPHLTAAELHDILKLMMEKEIRIRGLPG